MKSLQFATYCTVFSAIFLSSNAFPLEDKASATRFDCLDPEKPFDMLQQAFQPKPRSTGAGLAVAEKPFEVTVDCGTETSTCDKAKVAVEEACALIAQQLLITKTVKVKLTFKELEEGYIGMAAPAAYFVAKTANQTHFYFYPQALAKQLNTDLELELNEFDIFASFSSKQKYWFKGDGKIDQDAYDLSLIASHELTHGLGMISGVAAFKDDKGGYALPRAYSEGDSLKQWKPLMVYDEWMVDANGKKIQNYIEEIKKVSPENKKFDQFNQDFKNSGRPCEISASLYSKITGGSGSVQFAFNDTQNSAVLFAPENYLPASSLAHLDISIYENSTDFLMVHSAPAGETLQEKMKSSGRLYGRRTFQIMQQLGWPTHDNPTVASLLVQKEPVVESNAHFYTPILALSFTVLINLI